ncbi:hypothetical protein BASA81_002119 [Batrachochytrium salamandrivorans]|nr:hypothetical protein BASA81_002119 [Batrachochytrium salamandrivorans]
MSSPTLPQSKSIKGMLRSKTPSSTINRKHHRDSNNAAEVILVKTQQWMESQAQKLSGANTRDWERMFDEYCAKQGKEELTFDQLTGMFRELGTRVNRPMLQLLFSLFDANGNGTVDRHEFLVSVTFLAQAAEHDSTKNDIIDLAYFLFDTNRGGTISKQEFNNMCLVLINKAKFVLAIGFLRQAFRECLLRNHCEENLDFYEAVEQLVVKPPTPALAKLAPRPSLLDFGNNKSKIPYADLKRVFDDFISDQSPRQVNVSSANRKQVDSALALLHGSEPWVDAHIFDNCVAEIVGLLEADSLPRFKEEIRLTLADKVWKEEDLQPDDHMDAARFRRFAEKHPGIFSFLEELREILLKAQQKQRELAASKIQKAFRAYKGNVYLIGIVKRATAAVATKKVL